MIFVQEKASPLAQEGLDGAKGSQLYELSGILVHAGIAEAGHYYSYIKDRNHTPAEGEQARWHEYNDSEVSEFDPKDIPAKCYGGQVGFVRWVLGLL